MRGDNVSAEQVMAQADTTPLPPSVRALALDIAKGYAETLDSYGKKARPLWLKAWKAMHSAGVPRASCAGRLRTLIESSLAELHAHDEGCPTKFTSGYYKIIARKEGYAAPRPGVTLVDTNSNKPITPSRNNNGNGNDKTSHSPASTSDPARNGATSSPPSETGPVHSNGADAGETSVPPPPRPNHTLIRALQHTRRTYSMIEKALAEADLPLYIDDKQLLDLENTLLFVAQACADTMNRRAAVPPPIHVLFHELYRSEASLLNIGVEILRWRADNMEKVGKFITEKQAAKFRKGREPSQIPLYQPKSRDEAVFMGWYGLMCPNCESWRTKEAQHVYLTPEEAKRIGDDTRPLLQCYDCSNMWRGYTVTMCAGPSSCGHLFYREDLARIRRTGKCPSCEKEVRLPAHITQYLDHPQTWWQRRRRHPRATTPKKEVLP